MKVEFKSTGLVYGNFWGGGQGGYAARELQTDTKEELLKQANEGIKNGSLDAGMGYESLIGAILNITKITTIEIDGKLFVNEEYETEFVGDLTEEQQDTLMDWNFRI